eukprot:TRINITY_DN563_c3_g1_i1.p1 TRINITY_DN563_c3_g1~~TRINITY_DN563_c3_g1_i1.p1  ORF type:complete len:264 (+),score=81.40 TRINITY_DN563_c3_g1_i1:106-897(+)
MMRRGVANVARQARFQSAPAWAKPAFVEIFKSDFAAMEYPANAVGGEYLSFSKLLYKIAVLEKKEDKYIADLQKIMSSDLPPFWRTELNIATDKAFADMEPGLKFVLRWMQANNQMDNLEVSAKIFGAYVRSAKKVMLVPVTLAGLPSSQASQIAEAKKAAEATLAEYHADKKGWKLEFEYLVDPGIIDGWRIEVGSIVVENMSAYLKEADAAATGGEAIDYTTGPASATATTVWPENPETSRLAEWCEELSLFDAEESVLGA